MVRVFTAWIFAMNNFSKTLPSWKVFIYLQLLLYTTFILYVNILLKYVQLSTLDYMLQEAPDYWFIILVNNVFPVNKTREVTPRIRRTNLLS